MVMQTLQVWLMISLIPILRLLGISAKQLQQKLRVLEPFTWNGTPTQIYVNLTVLTQYSFNIELHQLFICLVHVNMTSQLLSYSQGENTNYCESNGQQHFHRFKTKNN